MNIQLGLNIDTIINCFQTIHGLNVDSIIRKKADQFLIEAQRYPQNLLPLLMQIIQQNKNDQIRFQALLHFSNVIKRTWTLRRTKQIHSQFQALKKNIRTKVLMDLYQAPKLFLFTYFDIVNYICKIDFPHHFPEFSQLVLKLTEQIGINQNSVTKFKELKEIFYELANRKGTVSKKMFDQTMYSILQKMCMASSYFDNQVHKATQNNNLQSNLAKLSKYTDQIILSILRMVNGQILDYQQILLIVKQQQTKLQNLLTLHRGCSSSEIRIYLQKNIKSLIYDLSSLQQSNPFMLSSILQGYFNNLTQIIAQPYNFIKNTTLKYTLLSMRKFIRQFSFYSSDELFMTSIGSKPKSKNYLDLRNLCHDVYMKCFNNQTIEGLLNHLIANLMNNYSKHENVSFDIDQNMLIDRNQQKQLTVISCCILLIEAILERFTEHSHSLIKSMVLSSYGNNFTNIDPMILKNVFGVLALLPKTCNKNDLYSLNQIPIVQILTYCYQNSIYKTQIPSLIAGWFDYFNNDQLFQLITVLLQFIQNQGDISLVLHCCQSLDKIIITKKYILNVDIIKKIFPIAIMMFQKSDNPQILWPMVNLLSNIIIQCQFDSDIIVQALQNNTLNMLISNNSIILVEALSEMFKNILCVIPRNKPAQMVYKLVCHFLNNHLSKLSSVISQKVLNLWYIAIREYSNVHNCNQQLITLYQNHYKNNLFYKTSTMIYILQEYMLLGFVQTDLTQFSMLIYEFYQQAEQLQRVQSQQLKVSALSFQITLITKYNLKQVNSQQMLRAILKDFYCFDVQKVSATVHNSLLSIINRYIILHRDDFFGFLNILNADLLEFYDVYLNNMQFLTSQSAKKINTLAVLLLIPYLPNDFLINKLHFILMIIISPIENYVSTQQTNSITNSPFTGKIVNSPTLRFASNFLSQRKQEIRKKGMFQEINLLQLFRNQINNVCIKLDTNINVIAQNFPENGWIDRFYKVIM